MPQESQRGEVVNGPEVSWRESFRKTLQAAFQVAYSWWYCYPYFLLALPAEMTIPWLEISKHEAGGPSRDTVKERCKPAWNTPLRGKSKTTARLARWI